MKRNVLSLAIVLLFSVGSMAQPATVWMNTYGSTTNGDWANHVLQTSDGGFAVTGVTDYFFMGAGGNIYLGKMDSFGNLEWNSSFAPAQSDEGMSLVNTADGGFAITGKTGSLMDYNVHLLKTDNSGNSLWAWTYGTIGVGTPDVANSLAETSGGGFIVTGETAVTGNGLDVYLLKTDGQGVEEWSLSLGGTGYDCGYCVQQTSDGGFVIAGLSESYGAGDGDAYIVKTDASGNELWHQVYGGPDNDYFNSIQQTADGGYIAAGMTTGYGDPAGDVYVVKTDASGVVEWIRHPGGNSMDEGRSVVITSDGGYVTAGYTESFGAGMSDIYLIKYDTLGNLEWELTEGTADNERGYSVAECSDGGFVVAGMKSTGGMGSEDILLVRFGEAIPPDYELTLTPLNPPIQIPANGGTFDYNILVDNNAMSTLTIDFWIMATLPNGDEIGPFIQVNDLTINALASLTRDRSQMIPMRAPAGIYQYTAYAGQYPGVITGESGFNFEKMTTGDGGMTVNGWDNYGNEFDDTPIEVADDHLLLTAYPNPFNNQSVISMSIGQAGSVQLTVYDIQGREAAELYNGYAAAGLHQLPFDGSGLTSGVYFVRLQSGSEIQTIKLLMVK